NDTKMDVVEIAANAWDELGLTAGASMERIVQVYREMCLKRALGIEADKDFYKKAIAYRFLASVPLARKEYRPSDILPLLLSMDVAGDDPEDDPARSLRACAMLDVSIACMERAQSPWSLPYVNYVINVHYCMRKHVVRRRYTEFQRLHQALMQKLPVIPQLPDNAWKHKLAMPSERARELIVYLSRIIQLLVYRGLFSPDIMAFLEIDYGRIRAEEEGLSAEYLNRISPVLEGSMVFIIDSEWMQRWRKFVLGNHNTAPPGLISNSNLLTERGLPRKNLYAPRQYRCLSLPAWKYFHTIYRGGPEISRSSKDIYGNAVLSAEMACIKIQSLARGYLARVNAHKRRWSLGLQQPHVERTFETYCMLEAAERKTRHIKLLVEMKQVQVRHHAAHTIQRAYRQYRDHLSYNKEERPIIIENTKNVAAAADYFTLAEIGMVEDDNTRFIHFIHTMQRGVTIRKLSSRYKPTPKLKFFTIDRTGAQLQWSYPAKPERRTLTLAYCTSIQIESPVLLKSRLGLSVKQTLDFGVVLTTPEKEVILIGESKCEVQALLFGLRILMEEGKSRLAGPLRMDAQGIMRRNVPNAKDVNDTKMDVVEIAANAWDELGLTAGASMERIVQVYREMCLKRALGIEADKDFYKKAIAYRFLASVPLARKEYRPSDILPLLLSMDVAGDDPEDDPARSLRACAMLDVSIACMERAQSPWSLPYVNYVINVHYCMRKHVVRRRYTEFQRLHQALMQKLPVIPQLPDNAWKHKLAMPSERARELIVYLSRIIQLLVYRGLFSPDIMAFLEIDYGRIRAEEEGLSAEYLNRISPVLEGSMVFIIDSEWMQRWRKFVLGNHNTAPPGLISNSNLLTERGLPRKNLYAPRQYRCLSLPAWKYFHTIYRGGPEISRSSKDIYGNAVLSAEMACIKIQSLARGYLARVNAHKRRWSLGLQQPHVERTFETYCMLEAAERKTRHIKLLVEMKQVQVRHHAAHTIQRAYRQYRDHLSYNKEERPIIIENTKNVAAAADYFTLAEIGMVEDDNTRFIHFIHTMQRGVTIRKLSSRYKPTPKLKFFTIDRTGAQLQWSYPAKPERRTLTLAYCTSIQIESPVLLKSRLGLSVKQTLDFGVVLTTPEKEVILIGESKCEVQALLFGLRILMEEGKSRLAGPLRMDAQGIMRRNVPNAKDVVREAIAAHALLEEENN
ncbi:hypothetical protein THRCLA_20691, partial [Thraustotheca clavata]